MSETQSYNQTYVPINVKPAVAGGGGGGWGGVGGGDLIVFVGLREGYLTDLFLFSLGRGYFSLSSPDVHWDQLNV